MPQFGGRAGAVWSGDLVFIQRGFRGLDDVRHDAQLLGGAAVQCVRQLGQGEAALAAAVEQQFVRLHAEGARQLDKNGQAQLGVARLDMAHMGDRDACPRGKLLLREALRLAVFAYPLPDLIVIQFITSIQFSLTCIITAGSGGRGGGRQPAVRFRLCREGLCVQTV